MKFYYILNSETATVRFFNISMLMMQLRIIKIMRRNIKQAVSYFII